MKIISIITACLLAGSLHGQGIYGLAVTSRNAGQSQLSAYQGQKIMFVILPAPQTADDTAFLARIDSVALAHAGQAKVVAAPSYEDGYVGDSLNTLLNWYTASLDSSIIVSQPLYTHVSSGAQQDSVFSWLTHASQNTHFDYEITGPGTMFFVDGQGQLVWLLGPEAKWSNKVLSKIFQ